jgi:predicted enzyme related to lactoylglutathione lyase
MTRDPDGSKAFYGAVFGWEPEDLPIGPGTYTTWKLGGKLIGGMMPMITDSWPGDLPPHWMVYFAVADADATAERAADLGGAVPVPPSDLPQGRFAVLNDPQGALFSVIKLNPA